MDKHKNTVSKRRIVENIIILLFCIFILGASIAVLQYSYEPSQNALGALASVCMDGISMMILVILVLNLAFEKGKKSRTTKLFLGLMLATILALFFDFLTWTSDGSLAYGEWSYVYTVSSLCCGSLLAAVFVFYLASYLDDMYGLKSSAIRAKIAFVFNMIAFVITVTLAVTGNAFIFENGHYRTGVIYDGVTVIPVLTLICMTIYALRNISVIGKHDVVAVAGYIILMIAGAIFESSYSVGTTYVGVTVADIFIFVMLQNKLIDRVTRQKDLLADEITSQFEILESMAEIYTHVNYVDFEEKITKRFDRKDDVKESFDIEVDPHSRLNKELYEGMEDELKEKFWTFTDLSTLAERMGNEKIITAEFCHKKDGWFRAQYIRIGEATDNPVKKVIYATRNIDEEKKNVEKWIRKSNTDELTGFYNRRAYEDEVAAIEGGKIKDNFVYVSIDVNSLKNVNDTLGHEAGDELLVGACECMKQCFGSYGKIFRTGGDEFVALIFADGAQLAELKKDVVEVTENWKGKTIDHLAISCGYVTYKEAGNISIRDMANIADKRMYDEKAKYYQKSGIDRRGQRDAHVALCAQYTKILKINVSDDSYQIINMNVDEQTKENGFADKISQWLHQFGACGQVHQDDLNDYLEKTSLEYISNYFKDGKKTLRIFYRRKFGDSYRHVVMEMIPANDYSDDMQNLFLYVKDIE